MFLIPANLNIPAFKSFKHIKRLKRIQLSTQACFIQSTNTESIPFLASPCDGTDIYSENDLKIPIYASVLSQLCLKSSEHNQKGIRYVIILDQCIRS